MKKLSWLSKISFGIGAFGKDAVYAIVGTFLMIYLTDVKSVAPAFVGTLYLVARIFDAVNDPLMGVIVDNTRSRWGRFRPWIMIGAVLNAIVLAMLFFNINLSGSEYAAYVAVLYILWGLTYTIDDIPYWSMVPAISEDPNDREQVSSIARLFASFAWLVVGSGGYMLVTWLSKGSAAHDALTEAQAAATAAGTAIDPTLEKTLNQAVYTVGFPRLAMAISVLFIVSAIIMCLYCKEARVLPPSAEKTTIKQMMTILFKNDQVLVMLGIAVFFNLGYQLQNGFAAYYFKYVAGSDALFAVYLGVAGIAQMVTMALFPAIVKVIGRPVAFFLAMAAQVAGFTLLNFLAPSAFTVGLCSAIFNVGIGFMLVLVTVSLADVVDYTEFKFGSRNEGIIFSMQTFVVKLAGAISGFIMGIGLTIIGFVANQEQSATTINGMKIIMLVVPAVLAVLTYLIYLKGFKLRGKYLDEVKAAIANK